MFCKLKLIAILSLVTILGTTASGQQCLQTNLAGGNGAQGAMFDIAATGSSNVVITGFSVHIAGAAGASVPFEVYTVLGGGSYAGNENSPGSWLLVGSSTVTSEGQGEPTPLGISMDVLLTPGQSTGFYVTSTSSSHSISYSNGTVTGGLLASSADITIYQGTGNNYPFAGSFAPRSFNGTVHHAVAGQAAEYQVNTAESSLTVNGAVSSGCAPAISTVCSNGPLRLRYRSNQVNQGFELAITGAAPLSASQGGTVSGSGTQVLNLDFSQTYWFLFGGSLFEFIPIQGDWDLDTIAPTNPGVVTMQAYHMSPSSADGFAVSQAAETDTIYAGPVQGPNSEDGVTTIDLASAPLCFTPGSLNFYGTSYTQIHVAANGRVLFGSPDADASPTVAEALLDSPFIGAWADFSPATSGNIQITASGNGLRVDYLSVPAFGSQGTDQSWAITFDSSDHRMRIEGLQSLPTSGASMFLGLSSGATGGATDPGATDFTQLGGSSGLPTDMLYEYGTFGLLAPNLSSVTFIPDGAGGYVWFAN